MKQEQLEAWRRDRAKGMLNYILIKGVLSYGLAMFIAMTLMRYKEMTLPLIGIYAIVWAIGGLLFGLLMWFVQERQYRKAVGGGA